MPAISSRPPTPDALSNREARRLAVAAQLLHRPPPRRRPPNAVSSLVRGLGMIQLDTISVLARSHELVVQARLGPVLRDQLVAGLWGAAADTFEYWAHAASILPVEDWPWFSFRRRAHLPRLEAWAQEEPEATRAVRTRLAQGPCTTADLGGARDRPGWWEWSPVKRTVERLLAAGEVVCRGRQGWRRVYDLSERAIPIELLREDRSDLECHVHLLEAAAHHLGPATLGDLADYYRIAIPLARRAIALTRLRPVDVEAWAQPAWVHPDLATGAPPPARRTTLLSPFDSLVWDRRRTERVFGFIHRLEAYVPRDRREHGYFAMPVLHHDRLVGRVDPAREGSTLIARRISAQPNAVDAVAAALLEAARWVRCTNVAVEQLSGIERTALVQRLRTG